MCVCVGVCVCGVEGRGGGRIDLWFCGRRASVLVRWCKRTHF
jgi:hypothetical protein